MAQSDSQSTVEYSYSDICDRDRSGYSDVSDTELSLTCDVLMQQRDMAWQINTLLIFLTSRIQS